MLNKFQGCKCHPVSGVDQSHEYQHVGPPVSSPGTEAASLPGEQPFPCDPHLFLFCLTHASQLYVNGSRNEYFLPFSLFGNPIHTKNRFFFQFKNPNVRSYPQALNVSPGA